MSLFLVMSLLCSICMLSNSRQIRDTDSIYLYYRTDLWAEEAFWFISNLTCSNTLLTTEEDCEKLLSIPKSEMNFYVAEPTPEGKLFAVLPDGLLTNRLEPRDAVLVVDPYPKANLGHLLVVFFVDYGWSESQCKENNGKYLDDSSCISLAVRRHCLPRTMKSIWGMKLPNIYRYKECEINFFPLVHLPGESPSRKAQRLECRDNFQGFAPCPTLRPKHLSEKLSCDPIESNTYACSNTGEGAKTRCRMLESCDQAVLIAGGWDRLSDKPIYLQNVLTFYQMLRNNGFLPRNIKTFYSTGNKEIDENEEIWQETYPVTLKLALRYHIETICQTMHCADSLVLYLSSPTQKDGSILLWDANGNGQAERNEVYTMKEMLYDIKGCAAQRVYIIADQSYSGMLVHALEHSQESYDNVIAFASGEEHEYSREGEYTKYWANYLQKSNCMRNTYEILQTSMTSSTPTSFQGSNGSMNTTLYGAPCNFQFTERELQREYFGCQNLPASVWLRRTRYISSEEEE
ncbi:uncharacterized protein LOC118188947 [Stegodyphus dumicola]|uniref:uncharacterized protein LOC118188947 n=1 Tax=Stegodyphus dumicola TaxID=202533 RepID=UPI0015A9C5E0|nr:uncharacterized protein LOC118188947 [Stegodyphus dumicola]